MNLRFIINFPWIRRLRLVHWSKIFRGEAVTLLADSFECFQAKKKMNPVQNIPKKLRASIPIPIYFFSVRKRAEFNKSCNLIGSGSGRNFPIRPALGRRNRQFLKNVSVLPGNLINDLCYYVSKNLAVKPLSSTWIIFVFITTFSLEIVQFVANLAMITALKCSVFRTPFVVL